MNRTGTILLLLLAFPAVAQAQRTADRSLRAGTLLLTGELGGAAFTDFQRVQARVASSSGEVTEFQRRVSAGTTATFGAHIGYWVTNGWGLRAGAAYAPSSFTVANEARAEQVLDARGTGERPSYASLDIWLMDGAVLFRFPRVFGRVVPYGIIGGGAVRYESNGDAPLPPEASEPFARGTHTELAAMFGLGAALPLQRRNLLLSFELTNHLSRSPLAGAARGEWFDVSGFDMQLNDDDDRADRASPGLTSNLRLVVGLSLPIVHRKEREGR